MALGNYRPGAPAFARFASYGWASQFNSHVAKRAKAATPKPPGEGGRHDRGFAWQRPRLNGEFPWRRRIVKPRFPDSIVGQLRRHCERRRSSPIERRRVVAFAPHNDEATPSHSRGLFRPSFVRSCPSKREGAGKAGCLCAPAASRPKKVRTRDGHHRSAGAIRPSLRDWF